MRWPMILAGVAVIAISVALSMALGTWMAEFRLIVEANSKLSAPDKQMITDWLRMTPTFSAGIIVAGLLAALPYFAVAQLLKPAPPRHQNERESNPFRSLTQG